MIYTDFVLLATEPRIVKAEGMKRLTFSLFAPGIFNDPLSCELDARAVADLKEKAGGPEANWKDARLLGEALAAALLPPDVWNALNSKITQATAVQEGVRVRLMLSGSELNNWPWEFMVFNRAGGEIKISDFLALMPNVSLVRHTATPLPAWSVEAKVPARVLVAVASPSGWPKLQVAEERSVVVQALEGCAQLNLVSVEHAQRSQLPNKANPAHLFHFAGHGKFEKVQSSVPGAYEGTASIILEDGYGDEDSLDAELLAVQLRDAGVRVAVLGACQTAQRDDLGAWSSVAEALLKAELGAVVGMQFPVRDKTALCFAQHFYGALAVGLSIDEAVAASRVAVAGSGDARGWATPVLYLRSPDGVIFTEFASDPALDTPRAKAYQEIDVLRGKATNVVIGVMTDGSVEAEQRTKVVDKGASLKNVVIEKMTGGTLDAKQDIGEVKGKSINVSIDELGFGGGTVHAHSGVREVGAGACVTGVKIGTLSGGESRQPPRPTKAKAPPPSKAGAPSSGAAPDEARAKAATPFSTSANVGVGNVTGGEVIGTQVNQREGDTVHGNQMNVASGGQASVNTGINGPVNINGPVTFIQGPTGTQPSVGSAPEAHEHTVEEKVRLDVALPKSAVVNETFDLVIAVRQVDAPTLTVADLDQVVSAEGSIFRSEEHDVVKYRVAVTGAGFQVTPESYLLELRPGANSRPIAFQVTSSRAGKRSLLVNAYQEDGALAAQTRLTIEVVVAVTPG